MDIFLKQYDIYFLPIVNPDGYDLSLNVRVYLSKKKCNLMSFIIFKLDTYWRKNLRQIENTFEGCFGVDLNRNFDYHWMSNLDKRGRLSSSSNIHFFLNILETGASDDICEEVYAGESPASEPEVRAIQDFIMSKKGKWISYVTLHSYGGYWLHHWENNAGLTRSDYMNLVTYICPFANHSQF